MYTLRRLSAGDAPGVAACALESHGAGYPRAELYSPEAIARRNAAGDWISLVAVEGRGRVVAHLALEPSASGPVAEMGLGMVSPDHRGHGLVERLRDRVVEEARRLGFAGQFVEIETGNVATQAIADRSPARPCGLTLGLWPAAGRRDASPAARRSFIRYFRYLDRPRPAVAHVPSHHQDIIARIYAQLGAPVELGRAAPPSGVGRMVVDANPAWGATFIAVSEVGADTAAELARVHHVFWNDPALSSAYLELPLAQAGAANACAEAERLGFFFSGVCPHGARDGDALRLQCLKHPARPARAGLLHPFTHALLDHALGSSSPGEQRDACSSFDPMPR